MRKMLQAIEHSVHAPPDPLGHQALPLSVLREAFPPEVRHEETHLHTHRSVKQLLKNYVFFKLIGGDFMTANEIEWKILDTIFMQLHT